MTDLQPIADAMQISAAEITGKSRALHLVTIRAAIAAAMYERGCDVYQIASTLNRDRTTVLYLLGRAHNHGIDFNPPKGFAEALETVDQTIVCKPEPRHRSKTISTTFTN